MKASIAIVVLLLFVLALPNVVWADHSHIAHYVPWSVDEYELFALTPAQLSTKFTEKVRFENDFGHAYLKEASTTGPQFLIEFKGGRVSSVQRLFLDDRGCKVMGPRLESKDAALEYSIDGLGLLPGKLDDSDRKRLDKAQRLLRELRWRQNNSRSSPSS